ncbi:MAG: OmpA family protein, partial [Leptospiraceae bacterium]|nr:OmpA family protein [Leptospiraceae bacterium]
RPGGTGGWDFYVTSRTESGWSEPRQIIELNSPGNEMHLSRVDNRFYFASDRSGGKGQYDLYFTEIPRLADSSEPEADPSTETANEKPERAESSDEQVALARNRGREDDLEGVLRNYDAAMDRAGEFESEEEYRRRIERGLELAFDNDPIERTTPKKDTLIVQDRDTGRPMSVQVKMRPYYKDEQKKRPDATLSRSDAEGTLQLPEFDSEGLELSITVPGYTPYHRVIDYRAVASGKRIVYLERAKKGQSFQVNDIKFDANSAVIRDESESYLESLIDFMKQNPAVRLKIVGHTDLHGSEEYNISLSLRRALSVRNYLVYHGIKEERLAVEGAGFSHPIVNKKGPPHDQINRRTEFVILEDGNP